MYGDSHVAVVVPAFNEEGLVDRTLSTVPDFVDRVYAVDDASSDGTWDEITRTARASPPTESGTPSRIVPIRHERNRGVGAAIRTGYDRAVADGMDVVAIMAGDGQMDPAVLPDLVDPVATGRVDYAKGNRLHHLEDRMEMSRWRQFGNAVLTMLTRISSGYWGMTDPQNGYTAISSRALETIPTDRLYDRYGFANDLLAVLNTYRFRIADVRHPAQYGEEQSGIRYSTFVPVLSWLLLRRFLWRLKTRYIVRGFHPLVPAYAVGITGVAGGLAAFFYSLTVYSGSRFVGLLAAASVFLIGTVLVIVAMWFDSEDNRDLVEVIDPAVDDDGLMAGWWATAPAEPAPVTATKEGSDQTHDPPSQPAGGMEQVGGEL